MVEQSALTKVQCDVQAVWVGKVWQKCGRQRQEWPSCTLSTDTQRGSGSVAEVVWHTMSVQSVAVEVAVWRYGSMAA